MNADEARSALSEAMLLVEAGDHKALVAAQLRRVSDALIPDATDEIEGTVKTRVFDKGEIEQLVSDRHTALVEAWGSIRFGGAQPSSSVPDQLLERLARIEVAIEKLSPDHEWVG